MIYSAKFQRLKVTNKLSKVYIVEEDPHKQRGAQSRTHTLPGKTMATAASTDANVGKSQQEFSEEYLNGIHSTERSQSREVVNFKQSSSKALMYYPEENHVVDEQACSNFNAQIMKHLLRQKTSKNETFYQSKMTKGESSFLQLHQQRSSTPRPMMLRKSYNASGPSSFDMRLTRDKNNRALLKSASDVQLRAMSRGSNSVLNNSKVVHNH